MFRNDNASAHPNVMVSSTYADLTQHRKEVTDALLRLGFFPLGMEFDSSKAGKDIITSSCEMVDKARAYIGIVSHRYGGVPVDAERNPDGLSITELEYRRALKRDIPVYMFLMSARHPLTMENVETVEAHRIKLSALRADAQLRSICKEFSSVEELKGLVLQSMHEFRIEMSGAADGPGAKRGRATRLGRREPSLAKPPQLLALPDFISGHEFVGRAVELGWLDEWAVGDDSLMVVEAIGGMGKSTLTWQWVKERARVVRPDLVGVLWYSFYEGGADMASFAAHALSYTTGQSLKKLRGRKTAELAQALIAALHERPFLLVLDGLERVLVAYHRLDASQARDDQVPSDRDHRACIKPADEELLRQLVAATQSKVLVTSRLLPTALTNKAGQPLPGVSHHELGGLHPDDALRMMRELDVRGDEAAIRRYLEENFENHPLLVGIVAGLVNDYIRDPGNFDRWAEDPQGGASLSLAALDLKQRRTHILAAALNGLEPNTRQLLSRIAALADAVPFETIAALNPFLPPPPSGQVLKEKYRNSDEVRQALPRLVTALRELGQRGLLQWDRRKNTYDFHPVVRGYAFDILEENERTDICNLIIDHFQSKPADRYTEAKTLADIQQSINITRALVQARRFNEAVNFISGAFIQALFYSVEGYHEVLTLLAPLFPNGFRNESHNLLDRYSQAIAMNSVALTLMMLNRSSEAREVFAALVGLNLTEKDAPNTRTNLSNLGIVFRDENHIAQSRATLELALDLAKSAENTEDIAMAHLKLSNLYTSLGLLERAEAEHDSFRRYSLPLDRAIYRLGMAEECFCELRFYQRTLTDELLDEAEAIAQSGNNRQSIRFLCSLRGKFALQRGNIPSAIMSFERAVEMTQKVGLPADSFEARLALAKAMAGEHEKAGAICDRLRESANPPDSWLASAYLEIGNKERARQHALEGYKWAWADGPPYSRHWELERCREVLRELGEPEPSLPAFDPKTVEPIPYEKEIRAFIADLKKDDSPS